MYLLNRLRIRDPKFLLLYSPLQFGLGEVAKPDGSLSLAYVAGALRRAGFEVEILDCTVGGKDDSLETTFFRNEPLPSGLVRIGMSPEAILEKAAKFDVVGVSSIFTPQSTMVLDLIRLIKTEFPEKLIVAGGVNARSLRPRFFDSGTDLIALSEAETTIVHIANALRGKGALTAVPGVAYRDEQGQEKTNPIGSIITDLDELPLPAWDLLPLKKYWDLSRPHGGHFPEGARIQYASLQTTRGCPFRCQYCHISEERGSPLSGDIGKLRLKSVDRVVQELEILKGLGVEYVFFEDDSLFAKKRRAFQLFDLVKDMGLQLLDVNGINVCHLYRNNGHDLEVDQEFLDTLGAAGFQFLTLPFESASQRVLDKYATSKWTVGRIRKS
jgi:anaerobic magnesium-protoporphyrin IX monomethyl ester cyclase